MESDRPDFNKNIREALSRYESGFVMPENLISDTMNEIARRQERRNYIRGLVAASMAILFMIAAAVILLIHMVSNNPDAISVPSLPLGSTLTETGETIYHIFSMPLVIMIAGAVPILLGFDYLLRTRIHPASSNR